MTIPTWEELNQQLDPFGEPLEAPETALDGRQGDDGGEGPPEPPDPDEMTYAELIKSRLITTAELKHILLDKTGDRIDDLDIHILKHLSLGVLQEEIEVVFKQKGITPNSKSTIEKRLGKLKVLFRANNTVHLIAIAKDLAII